MGMIYVSIQQDIRFSIYAWLAVHVHFGLFPSADIPTVMLGQFHLDTHNLTIKQIHFLFAMYIVSIIHINVNYSGTYKG